MIFKYWSRVRQQKILRGKLKTLEKQKSRLQNQLAKTQSGNRRNARQSDRKFKENNSKALSARAKRANKSDLSDIDRQIKSTKGKLNDIHSINHNQPLVKLKKWLSNLK